MKLLILSDLHSNPQCLRAVWEKEGGADAVYAAGDFVDYGPFPSETIAWVRAHGVRAVCGNHDRRVTKIWRSGDFSDVPKGSLAWAQHNCRMLREEDIAWLESLPEHLSFEADGIAYLMQHQYGPRYEIIESQYHFDRWWEEHYTGPKVPGQERRMIFGHTHRQGILQFPCGLWLNPGSASYRRPDEPSKDAFYAVIDNGVISLRHTPYDASPLYAAAESLRTELAEGEYRVARFFFGMTEADGPDEEWIRWTKQHTHA